GRLEVPGAARIRLVGDAADLVHGEILIDRRELQPQRRHLLGDHLHGVFVQDMGVDVDGLWHGGPPREGSHIGWARRMPPLSLATETLYLLTPRVDMAMKVGT